MTPLDFAYHRPQTVELAVHLHRELSRQGEQVLYYAGGTEIITLGRLNQVFADSVIDIKSIPQTLRLRTKEREQRIGCNITLTELADSPQVRRDFPLLTATVNEIADRTARNKITFGGNICGKIHYREAVLPLLVADSQLFIAGRYGVYITPIHHVFRGAMQLRGGEILLAVGTDEAPRTAPSIHIKRRKIGEVGYPVVTAAAIRIAGSIRVALSGICAFPFRWWDGETILNQRGMSLDSRIEAALLHLPAPILHDTEASREYRKFVLKQVLWEVTQELHVPG